MTDSIRNKNSEDPGRGTIKVPMEIVDRLHAIVHAERKAKRPVPTFAEIVTSALDAYENMVVTGTEVESTPGTGRNSLFLRVADYARALAKIDVIVREVFSAEGESVDDAGSGIDEIEIDSETVDESDERVKNAKAGTKKNPKPVAKRSGRAS